MKRMLLLIMLALLMVGCDPQKTVNTEIAMKLANDYIEAVQSGDYDKAFSLCHPDFFGSRTKQQWIQYHEAVKEKMGKLQSMKLKHKLADDRLTGTFFMFQFATKYEKGLAKEMVTMIQKINTDEPLRIFGYKIDSSKLAGLN